MRPHRYAGWVPRRRLSIQPEIRCGRFEQLFARSVGLGSPVATKDRRLIGSWNAENKF